MTDTFIITGANGDIAISISEILREFRPKAKIIGTDIIKEWSTLETFDEFIILPKVSEPGYLTALQDLQIQFIDSVIIPTSEPELYFLAKQNLELLNLNLLMNSVDLIHNCMDKLKSIEWLKSIGIEVPRTQTLAQTKPQDLPIIAKPRFGSGSRGLEIIRDKEHLCFSQSKRTDEPIAQELLDVEDQEYTCAILSLPSEYKSFIMHRKMKGDVTGKITAIKNHKIENILQRIVNNIPPYSTINVQLRLTEQGPMIFEINPRFSSTVKMRHLLGFRDFQWAIELYENKEMTPTSLVYNRVVFRTYHENISKEDL